LRNPSPIHLAGKQRKHLSVIGVVVNVDWREVMHLTRSLPSLAAAALIVTAVPAFGDDKATCNNPGPDAIAACTRLIESGELDEGQRGEALLNRGVAYVEANAFGRAIPDIKASVTHFDEAIRRNPSSAPLFHRRAEAYQLLQRSTLAIADYEEAFRLDPKDIFAKHAADKLRADATSQRP
jgi:tetratricopeptide (TPR) repeat protein